MGCEYLSISLFSELHGFGVDQRVGEKMKNSKFGSLAVLAVFVASFGSAMAQTIHHDKMDARAARADIIRLQADRREAKRTRNWGKVAQDDRLIAADRHFMKKDIRKVDRSGG